MRDPYTPDAFRGFGVESIAYAKLAVASNPNIIAGTYIAIYDASGIQLAIAPSMDHAAYLAREHDLELQYLQ